jgi:hypothetical protein
MRTKILAFLLTLLAVGYSVAPAWVDTGVNLNYSVGSDTVSFSVLNRTATDIRIQTFTFSTSHNSFPDENASADSGQFWFDTSLLSSASSGDTVGSYSVTDESTQTFAGKSWDTVTLEGTVSGAMTTKVFDKTTGLLLKQTVDVSGAPVITLVQYHIPALEPAPVVPPQANNTAPPKTNTTPPATNTTTPAVNTTQPAVNVTPPSPQNNGTTQPQTNETPPGQPSASSSAAAPAKKHCFGSAFLLLVIGLVALRNGPVPKGSALSML